MLIRTIKRRKKHQKDQTQVSDNFKLPPYRVSFYSNYALYYAEKAKQAPGASSAGLELIVQTNEHQFQSSQDAQGNATIGRPYYYQVHRKSSFSSSFWHLTDLVLTYFMFNRLFQMPLSNQTRCTCIQICTQCPFAHRRYSHGQTELNMFLSPCKDQCDLTEGGGWVGSLCRGLSPLSYQV